MNTIAGALTSATIAVTVALGPALTAQAAPVAAETSIASVRTIGKPVPTDPKHHSSLAAIPICKPHKWIPWMIANFKDHGRDIITAMLSGNPVGLAKAIPKYAWNDAKFHMLGTLTRLGGCI